MLTFLASELTVKKSVVIIHMLTLYLDSFLFIPCFISWNTLILFFSRISWISINCWTAIVKAQINYISVPGSMFWIQWPHQILKDLMCRILEVAFFTLILCLRRECFQWTFCFFLYVQGHRHACTWLGTCCIIHIHVLSFIHSLF